ncbi:MAG: hypothetical protein GY795_45875 [Desulfobacterales bacterium]|nr:hypothetical protein [Desulfobacterales bacterium]
MNQMKYDALNLGENDFYYGNNILAGLNRNAEFFLLNANIKAENPLWKPYIIKEIKGIKVAVTGIVSESLLKAGSATIVSPHEALRDLVPELKKKFDVVILMSRLEYDDTVELVKNIPGIHVAIMGNGNRKAAKFGNTIVTGVDPKGQFIGVLEIQWNTKKKIAEGFENQLAALDKRVESDLATKDLIQKYHDMISSKIQQDQKELAEHDRNNMIEKMKKMTPEEFMEQYKKQEKKQQQLTDCDKPNHKHKKELQGGIVQ